jgi:hypothetical protein
MPQPQPLEVGKGKTIMVYGVPGAGKTRYLVGTSPKCLIIRPPDDHTDSIAPGADCEELIVEDWSGMFETFAWLQQGAAKDYKWVWLDSISLMQDRLLEDVVTDMLIRRPDLAMDKAGESKERERWVELKEKGVVVPEYGPDKGEYKINFERLARWVRDMTGLAKAGAFNFGITAHPIEWYDPTLEEDVWAPWVQGKNMIPKICGYMNIVAYLQEQKGESSKPGQRVLMVDQKGFMGKDQLFCFPELKSGRHGIIDPTGDKLIKAIKGSSVKPASEAAPSSKKRPRKVVRRRK